MLKRLLERLRKLVLGDQHDFRQDVERMMQGLNLQADAASFAMARADEVRDQLRNEIENHEALGRQAEHFMRANDERAAQRCVILQVQSAETIGKLREKYAELQKQAELKLAAFRQTEEKVKQRREQLPELEQDQRILQLEQQIQRATTQLSLDSPISSFDQASRELRIRRQQLSNKGLLEADPNAELDRRIKQALGQKKIDDAMAALRKRLAEENVVEGEVVSVTAINGVDEARKLLEAPRYEGLGISAGTPDKALAPVLVRREETK